MHNIIFLRQYLPFTLLLLKCYCKFVPKIQPRCWILQIVILENDHKIYCISLKLTILWTQASIYTDRVMFHITVNNAWNLFNFSGQSPENSTENHVSWFLISWKLLSIDWVLFSIDWSGIEQRSRYP